MDVYTVSESSMKNNNDFIIYGLIGLHVAGVAGELCERYEQAVNDPLITALTAYRMPVAPHGHETTYASTRIAEPWNLAQVTTAPMITAAPLTWPRGTTAPST